MQLQHDKGTSETSGRLIAQANRSVKKLTHLVNDLFDASRLSERKFTLANAVFDLARLVHNCCSFVESYGKHRIVVNGQPAVELSGDEEKIEQVLANLVENAMKYAPAAPTITITIEQLPGNVRVSVSDEGPGIPDEFLPHVFRKYFRPESSMGQTELALGLYICAEIIKAHGGEIGVESEQVSGTTFWFTLPS